MQGACDIDLRDHTGRTALHYAAKTMRCHSLEVLLDKGANMHLTDNYGNTPLHIAARSGSEDCVDMLTSR